MLVALLLIMLAGFVMIISSFLLSIFNLKSAEKQVLISFVFSNNDGANNAFVVPFSGKISQLTLSVDVVSQDDFSFEVVVLLSHNEMGPISVQVPFVETNFKTSVSVTKEVAKDQTITLYQQNSDSLMVQESDRLQVKGIASTPSQYIAFVTMLYSSH